MVTLDLHGETHEEAKRLLERTLNSMWGSEEELEIITGNSRQMKRIVIDILKEYTLEYTIGDWITHNNGYIKTILD